jgi:DNA (cytosine-5)-methyltransferase 1
MIGIDFFSGAGGLTRGLVEAGVPVALGIDIDAGCRETYERNNPGSRFVHADVRRLDVRQVERALGRVDRDELLIAACAPCQPFAQLNRSGRDERATLLGRMARFVEALMPGQIFVENVPGLARVRASSTLSRFRNTLMRLGYGYWEGVLDAKAYGVPQTRRRFIIIAVRDVEPTPPPATHGTAPDLQPYETVANAINAYPALEAGEVHPAVPNHRAARLSPLNLERIRHTPHDGGDRTAWPEHLWLNCHRNGYTGHTDVYGRMHWHRPAPTLTCKCHSLTNGRYGHPEQDRAISFREAARLQSFGDDYVFHTEIQGQLATQIGNAVPVRLATAVGRHIRRLAGEIR